MSLLNSPEFILSDLAERLSGKLAGDPSLKINKLNSLEQAEENSITFLSDTKYLPLLSQCKAGAVLLKPEHAESFTGNKIIVANPYLCFATLSKLFDPRPRRKAGVHPMAVVCDSAKVSPSASIGANAYIGENVVIGEDCEIYPNVCVSENSVIGRNCILYSNVSVYSDVTIGDDVIIHSSTVIGSDGFGFAPSAQKGWQKIHQLGGVTIGHSVEIGSSTTIDRGALSDTKIADGVIIDNQVHIAHNVEIGQNTAIAGCTGIAGSTRIGKNCVIAGGVGITGHIDVADNTHYLGGSIVLKGNKEGGVFASGTPLMDAKSWRRSTVRVGQLDDLFARVKSLEKKV